MYKLDVKSLIDDQKIIVMNIACGAQPVSNGVYCISKYMTKFFPRSLPNLRQQPLGLESLEPLRNFFQFISFSMNFFYIEIR